MKRLQLLCFALCSAFMMGAQGRGNPEGLDQADATVGGDRPLDLLTEAVRHRWAMWPIRSQWAIDRLPSAEEKAAAGRSLEFGHRLATMLDRLALTVRERDPNGQDALLARWLVDLGDWIASGGGSGNAFLAQRCLDLATMPLSRLIVSDATTDAQLTEYEQMLQPRWAGVKYRAEVLNSEIGARLFNPEGDQQQMQAVDLRESGAAALAAMVKAGINPGNEPLLKGLARPDEALEKTGYFGQESQTGPATASNRLGQRNAGMIVSGLGDGNARGLRDLIRYKRRMKTFPAATEGADFGLVFDEAWKAQLSLEELRNDELRTLGGSAGRVFGRMKSGKFSDQDTLYARRGGATDLTPIAVPPGWTVPKRELLPLGR